MYNQGPAAYNFGGFNPSVKLEEAWDLDPRDVNGEITPAMVVKCVLEQASTILESLGLEDPPHMNAWNAFVDGLQPPFSLCPISSHIDWWLKHGNSCTRAIIIMVADEREKLQTRRRPSRPAFLPDTWLLSLRIELDWPCLIIRDSEKDSVRKRFAGQIVKIIRGLTKDLLSFQDHFNLLKGELRRWSGDQEDRWAAAAILGSIDQLPPQIYEQGESLNVETQGESSLMNVDDDVAHDSDLMVNSAVEDPAEAVLRVEVALAILAGIRKNGDATQTAKRTAKFKALSDRWMRNEVEAAVRLLGWKTRRDEHLDNS